MVDHDDAGDDAFLQRDVRIIAGPLLPRRGREKGIPKNTYDMTVFLPEALFCFVIFSSG